nr:hypothetical protein [Sphingomonas sp. AR_OL41]
MGQLLMRNEDGRWRLFAVAACAGLIVLSGYLLEAPRHFPWSGLN